MVAEQQELLDYMEANVIYGQGKEYDIPWRYLKHFWFCKYNGFCIQALGGLNEY